MAKKKMRWPALLLSLAMVVSLLPAYAAAADTSTWNVSKSKTATELNNDETTVTLSLPSAQETLASDIVFVLDKSSCKEETATSAGQLMTALENAVQANKANIKIGVVAFDGTSHVLYDLASFTGSKEEIATLTEKLTQNMIPSGEKVSGTNMQAGLMAAKNMLDGDTDTSVSAKHKYMVMISDGLTRLFTGSDGKVKDIYYQYSYADKTAQKSVDDIGLKNCVYFGMIDEWRQVRTQKETGAYELPAGCSTWSDYYTKLKTWVTADQDKYALDFETYGNDPTNIVKETETGAIRDSGFVFIGHNEYQDHAMSVDRAVYEAYNEYQALVDEGFSCYAINVGTSDFSATFMGVFVK